jgi:DNA-binding transcriptional regulator YiaG
LISSKFKELIKAGWSEDCGYKSRSELDMAVICELLRNGMDDNQIRDVFQKYEIGIKYRERRDGDKYLAYSISKARAFMKDNVGSPQPATDSEIKRLVSLEDFAIDKDDRPALIEGVLWRGDILLLYGASGIGKSVYVTNTIGALVNGIKCLELWPSVQCKVGLFDYELPEDELRSRSFTVFGFNPNFFVNSYAGRRLNDDKHVTEIETNIKELNLDVIVIDPLSAACDVKSENDPAMREVMNRIRGIAKRNNVAVIVVHHTGKDRLAEDGTLLPKTPRGHSSISDAVDLELQILGTESNDVTRLQCTKSRRTRGVVRRGWDCHFVYDSDTMMIMPETEVRAVKQEVANLIKDTRARFNLSQTRFGELVGVPKLTVTRWESGIQPHTLHLLKIRKVVEDLVAGKVS